MIMTGDTLTFIWGLIASTPAFGIVIIALLILLVGRQR